MFRRSRIVLLFLASCGSAERHENTTPADDVAGCPSETAPERCRDLAAAAANDGQGERAWAYTVLECESPSGAQCAVMWQRHAKAAPTQTDALNVLHAACDHIPAACEQLAAWHTERGHVRAAAAYRKQAVAAHQTGPDSTPGQPSQLRAASSLALAAELAAVMHISDVPPRTDAIAQLVGRELRAPVIHAVGSTKPVQERRAWPMHAATLGGSSDACAGKVTLDGHPAPLEKCVTEVRPIDDDQIALRNRCGQAISVSFAGARADHSTYTKQLQLRPFEANSTGISHRELGTLTYAVCTAECRATSSPDDVTASWNGRDASYYCSKQ